MNLKEAFRFQNKLQSMMETAEDILGREQNITRVQNTYLRRKVMAEAEDETTFAPPATEYSEQITEAAAFLLFLLAQRETLSAAIYRAKAALDLPAGLDGEVGSTANGRRSPVCCGAWPACAPPRRSSPAAAPATASTTRAIRSPIAAMSGAWSPSTSTGTRCGGCAPT